MSSFSGKSLTVFLFFPFENLLLCAAHVHTANLLGHPFGAGLVVMVVDPKPGERIIDCCAAPGGKTLFMASLLNDQGTMLQNVVTDSPIKIY